MVWYVMLEIRYIFLLEGYIEGTSRNATKLCLSKIRVATTTPKLLLVAMGLLHPQSSFVICLFTAQRRVS